MVCTKCGDKLLVSDIVHTVDNETYRLKECKNCGEVMYTGEFEVEMTPELKNIWKRNRRRSKRFYEQKECIR